MRAWTAGEVVLLAAISLAAGLGLASRSAGGGGLGPPLAVLVIGLLGFLAPVAVALLVPAAQARRAFWLASCLPAAAWVPALPYVLLRTGPPLGSPGGLAIAGASVVGAVLVLTGGVLAALEVPRGSP